MSIKSIDQGQPTRTAQADLSRYFLLRVNFLNVEETVYLVIESFFIFEQMQIPCCSTYLENTS